MSRPLSIGMVCFPSLGGSGVVASELAAGLATRGHRVHLLASARPARAPADGERLRFHQVFAPDYPLFAAGPYSLGLASKLAEVCRSEQLDLVQVHYAVPHAVSAYLARQMLGAEAPKLVTSLHGTDVTKVGPDPAYRSVTAFAIAASDGVTVPSDFLRREAFSQLELPSEVAVEVIPNFVDTDRFTPAETRDPSRFDALFGGGSGPVLFHVSNFRVVKRITDLFEVLARVRRTLPARLVLVGDGPERVAAQERMKALGLDDCVRFLGRRCNFADDLRHADGFLLPSETESFGVAALEALSAGVPVFAYRVGGLPEVVTEEVGRLVPPFDVEALAAAVVEVIRDPARVNELGRAARRHVLSRYKLEPALDRYEAYFRRILTETR